MTEPSVSTPFIPDDFKYSTKVSSCENEIKLRFLRNVYSILLFQLTLTFAFGLYVYNSPKLQYFIVTKLWVDILAIVIGLVTCIWLSFAPSSTDEENEPWYVLSFPQQLALLFVFTLAEAYSLSIVVVVYRPEVILNAVMMTLFVVIGITTTLMSTNYFKIYDFQKWYYWLNMLLWVMIGFSLSSIFFSFNTNLDLLISWVGVILFTGYIFVDTQLILRKVLIGEEIKCAMMLYLDIINLFLYILRILSRNEDD
ncbi:uncharacterized vacuolar membrane protein YNL305C [Kluyveromyces marxianus]|uniref:Uncharacterized vacuolar membrane protein YNL305C n=2 Tax=Kluyveromyces marxianus TaxID=4911 RepID=W0TCA1_KLUMD|nr:uncharacterized protein KLMA_40392 [Kluyveromyces marxianus DMKU3-1042]QGN16147.1 putative vacuolar membrane protein YNL305C [Kluyveromyces marxianus]BAO40416.1 uncharacterized vacuolar membrane protein YNL305C [Kluyveromyces marxianus DMKU3-1042]BAP71904.1 uncharacterized vacuolar membrane protein YNL305C [Kluyveromyces marxianus]